MLARFGSARHGRPVPFRSHGDLGEIGSLGSAGGHELVRQDVGQFLLQAHEPSCLADPLQRRIAPAGPFRAQRVTATQAFQGLRETALFPQELAE